MPGGGRVGAREQQAGSRMLMDGTLLSKTKVARSQVPGDCGADTGSAGGSRPECVQY